METKEAETMKRHWRLGILLGVSLALLLAGGVALAQVALRVTVDPDCFVCTPRADWPPSEGQFVELTFSGYDTNERLCASLMMDGVLWDEGCWEPELPGPPCTAAIAVRCEDLFVAFDDTCHVDGGSAGAFAAPSSYPAAVYGEWTWALWQEDEGGTKIAGPVEATFRFAEVCEEEFVPEPGTLALLGSGLAGLAGYATLRWRSRS
jgi:hypothetical protein